MQLIKIKTKKQIKKQSLLLIGFAGGFRRSELVAIFLDE
ncbi:MAG: hypothetical protein CM1200mP13_05420 [Candidatus Pelagibacterales bacterium]|nr:MAG: hypothetical protein CM1200mP13_05420 [Pelagibacterales bacterium]